MLDSYLQDYINKSSTRNFILSATELTKFLESDNSEIELYEYLLKLENLLSKLYTAWLELEKVEVQFSSDLPIVGRDDIKNSINFNILNKLWKNAFYCDVYDPVCYNEYVDNDNLDKIWKEVTQGWLIDDIWDIYHDIKPDLITLEFSNDNRQVEDALFQLQFWFHNHWGKHCIDAMRFLYHYT